MVAVLDDREDVWQFFRQSDLKSGQKHRILEDVAEVNNKAGGEHIDCTVRGIVTLL